MNDDVKAAMAAQLAQLRAGYLESLPRELTALIQLSRELDGNDADRPALDELHHRLHKLAGSGGTFGLTSLSSNARCLEIQVKKWLADSRIEVDEPARKAFIADLEALFSTLDQIQLESETSTSAPVLEWNRSTLIWLIGEDPELGNELTHQLESFNYEMRQYPRISLAEQAAAREKPDLLLLSAQLKQESEQDSDVFSQCPQLRATECPVLFISDYDDFSSRVQAVRLGAMGYFLKPLDVPRLVGRITQIFDQQQAPLPRVLIVDDDTDLADYLRLVLLAAGMEAEVLQQPAEIMDKLNAFRPDLVLMDLHMPDVSGPELAGVIRQHDNWSSLPIVYLSAETDLDQQMAALHRGADDFLTKPISDAQLVTAIRVRVERARQLEELITRDSLTGLLKHASIKDAAGLELHRARRNQTPVCLAMLDIDHFKKVNDTYGHATGDVVISSVAMLLRQRLRQSDIIGRYGGEEFVVVLPECAAEPAFALLEEIRSSFSDIRFSSDGEEFSCTISAGVICSDDYPEATSEDLLIKADEALYVAKKSGRNRVQLAGDKAEKGD